jgi:tetratricopeptide (TPR) repeat protein
MKPLQIEGARALADAGAIKHVRLVASAEGLYVEINRTFTVANRKKETRYFAKSDTCLSWLHEIGVRSIAEVDLTDWGADSTDLKTRGLSILRALGKYAVSSVIGSEWIRRTREAESLSEKGKHAEALLIAKQALQMAEGSLEPDHIERAIVMNCVARQHLALQQFAEAEPLFKYSLEIAEKALGPDDLWVAVSLNELSETCDALGKSDETEAMYLRALTICEKKAADELRLDPTHSDHSFEAMIATNLASLYLRQGHFEQAESLYKRALGIWQEYSGLLGKKHPNTALTLKGLAKLYRKTGREEKATKLEK